jgi:plastocyanin
MTRLAGITTIYGVIAVLTLSAPLSASEEVPPGAPASSAEPAGADPEAGPPETAPREPAAGDAPAGGTAPQEPAPREPAAGDPPPPEAAPPVPAPAPETASAHQDSDPPAGEAAPPAGAPADGAPAAPAEPARDRSTPRAKAAADTTVTIRDFEFAPSSVTVNAGDTVTWSNEGPTPHSATADDGSFDTGIYGDGQSRSHTFEQAGTFRYFCTPHPQMRGTVTVRAASQDDGGGAGGGSGGDAGGGAPSGDGTATDEGTASADGSGSALPATGLDSGGLVVLGLVTLALGACLRRRASTAG